MAQAATLNNEPFDLNAFTKLFARGEYALGLGVMALVMMLIIPIPPFLLDFLLAISITLSVLILMTALLIKKRSSSPCLPSTSRSSTAEMLRL
jgi:flagellar biosynthesis protein FlhA